MTHADTVSALAAFAERGAGTDAERRAALWAAARLRACGREVLTETFWCRPNWALAQAWHVALGLAGSLLGVHSPRVGAALILVALIAVVADAVFAVSPGRWLSPERASQNVIGLPPAATRDRLVALILTANLDAGRAGLVYRDSLRRPAARARALLGRPTPGWTGWLALLLGWLLAVAIVRFEGAGGTLLGAVQLIPTIALVMFAAGLLDLAGAAFAPAAADNASGVAAVLEIARALDAEPLGHAAVHIVLTGAGDVAGLGLRDYLRGRRRSLRADNTVVVGLAACGAGAPRYWHSDGQLVAQSFFRGMRDLCRETAAELPDLGLEPHRGRGATPALAARLAGIPAISLGALQADGLAPRSHQRGDVPGAVDPDAIDRAVEIGLLLADGIDGFLAARPTP